MRIYRLAWLIWSVGTVLIVLSWTDAVSTTVGWAGFGIALLGFLLSAVPHVQKAESLNPEQAPVQPSGLDVGPRDHLEQGSRVLAYSQGYWWRARVVAVEEGDVVRVDFPGWDPNWQARFPRSELQIDVSQDSDFVA